MEFGFGCVVVWLHERTGHKVAQRPSRKGIILVDMRDQKSLRRNDHLRVVIKVKLR